MLGAGAEPAPFLFGETMAGRVLSKKNETALRDALKALADVLGQLGDGEEATPEAKEAAQKMAEAANVGHWFEANLHLQFTQLADYRFADGLLTREERIGLSSAIGAALEAFNASVAENMPHLYQRNPWQSPESAAAAEVAEAAIESDCVPLTEAVLRPDNTARIKIIRPGWGSSGYYPKEVLRRDGPKIFKAGLHMHWNHATPAEEAERPEGSLDSLAGELVTDAHWQEDNDGGGLYADAKVFGRYKEAVEELAPHIGVSIRAMGKASPGEAEGKRGAVISELTAACSIDYVTVAGAGGRVVQMFEAARTGAPTPMQQEESMTAEESAKLQEAQSKIARLEEALLLRDARDFVAGALAGEKLPDVTRARLAESLSANPPVKDGALDTVAFGESVKAAAQAEREYLASAAGYTGTVQGMGSAPAAQPATVDTAKRMAEAFKSIGLSDKAVTIAVNGRG